MVLEAIFSLSQISILFFLANNLAAFVNLQVATNRALARLLMATPYNSLTVFTPIDALVL